MSILFSKDPYVGQIYSYLNVAWQYNGYAWNKLTSGAFYYQPDPPTGITFGTRWMDSDTGIEYIYIYDGDSPQWVQPTNDGSSTVIQATKSITGSSYSCTIQDYYIGVSYGGTCSIILPQNPETGRMMVIKDESGNAGDPYKYIVITGATLSDKIDNRPSAILNIDNGALDFIYRNGWRII